MNDAELMAAMLCKVGIRCDFGVPGDNIVPLVDAMRHGGIDFVLTAREGSAGFAAEIMARRMTGAPGLYIARLGPGATDLATGIAADYPVVIEARVDGAHYMTTVYD